MKRVFLFLVAVVSLFVWGCQPGATESELRSMCENLAKVRGEAEMPNEAEMTASVTKEFVTKQKDLQAWKARDMRGWDEELEKKIAEIEEDNDAVTDDGKPATKKLLVKEYAKKKEVGAKQFDADLAALDEMKKKALANVVTRATEEREVIEEKMQKCTAEAQKEGVSQPQAKCRIAAPDKDTYWNKCK